MRVFPQAIRELSCLPFSDHINAVALSAGAAKQISVPDGARFVIFSSTADFYVRSDGQAATVPGDTSDGTACELNPTMRYLADAAGLSVISSASCVVTTAFYK